MFAASASEDLEEYVPGACWVFRNCSNLSVSLCLCLCLFMMHTQEFTNNCIHTKREKVINLFLKRATMDFPVICLYICLEDPVLLHDKKEEKKKKIGLFNLLV